MEASALHPPARFARLTSTPALLRLRSDEQLVSLLRAGSHEAFRAIHERYGQRLFAYVRQMLGPGLRQDAEDVLQDVFARTYTILKADEREINLRPWLYRVAHNRCIDHLRRPGPATTELVETSGKPLHDPFEEVQRREDLQRLVSDIGRLPDQQKSALLLREINGLSYRELAEALDVSVPAVKSLLVRARVELVETAEARDTACAGIREELSLACDDRSARQSPRVRRHVRDCMGCQEYQAGIRGMRRSFAALSPVAVAGPLAALAKLAGLGGGSGGSSAGAGAGGTGLAGGLTSGGLAAGTAGKIAVVASTAAIAAGGAVALERRAEERATTAPGAETAAPAAGSPANGSDPAALRGIETGAATPLNPVGDPTGASGAAPAAGGRRSDEVTPGPTGTEGGAASPDGSAPAADPNAPAAGFPAVGAEPVGDRNAGSPTTDSRGGGGSDDSGRGGSDDTGRSDGGDVTNRSGSPGTPVRRPQVPADRPERPGSGPKAPPVDRTAPTPAVPPVKDKVDRAKPDTDGGSKPGKVADPKPGNGPGPKVDNPAPPKVEKAPGPPPKVEKAPGPPPKAEKAPGPPPKVEKAPGPPPKVEKAPSKPDKAPELKPETVPAPKADKAPPPKAYSGPAPKPEKVEPKPAKAPDSKPGRGPKVDVAP